MMIHHFLMEGKNDGLIDLFLLDDYQYYDPSMLFIRC